jgi:hypothetical protein
MTTNVLAQARDTIYIKYYVEEENKFGTMSKVFYTESNIKCMIQQQTSIDDTSTTPIAVTTFKVFLKRNVLKNLPDDFNTNIDTIVWNKPEGPDVILEPIADIHDRNIHFQSIVKHVVIPCKKIGRDQ